MKKITSVSIVLEGIDEDVNILKCISDFAKEADKKIISYSICNETVDELKDLM